jgi:hypothetical protein
MATQFATPSFSMPRALHRRLDNALPRYGDKSKLVACLIEMWLDGALPPIRVHVHHRVVIQHVVNSGVLNTTKS